jgi:hypothetical protein
MSLKNGRYSLWAFNVIQLALVGMLHHGITVHKAEFVMCSIQVVAFLIL